MATDQTSQETAPAPKSRKKTLLLVLVCGAIATAGGALTPHFLLGNGDIDPSRSALEQGHDAAKQTVVIPFGDVVVNLNEDRLTRYLRVKINLSVSTEHETMMTELVEKRKATLKSWLISHLSGKSLDEVKGSAGINRTKREVWQQFNRELFADGSDLILDVLFEEFVIQ